MVYGTAFEAGEDSRDITDIDEVKEILRSCDFSHEDESGKWFRDKGLGVYVVKKFPDEVNLKQCAICEIEFTETTKDNFCPNCGSDNWVYGNIDEPI